MNLKRVNTILIKIYFIGSAFLLLISQPLLADSLRDYTTYQRYNVAGQLTGVISGDPDGTGPIKFSASRNSYNSKGSLIKTEIGELSNWQSSSIKPSNWIGFTVFRYQTFTYDTFGRQTINRLYDGNGNVYSANQVSYGILNRIDCQTVRMNKNSFNSLPGDACTLGVEGNEGSDRITQYSYNSKGFVLTVKKALGTAIEQTYATYTYEGNLRKTITDANGNLAQMKYDDFGRLIYWYFPSKGFTGSINPSDYEHYQYDANSNQNYVRKREGSIITYTHDKLNRTTKKDLAGTVNDVYYDYDLRGLQLYARFASNSGQGVSNIYDGSGLLTRTTTSMGGTSRALYYQYDKNGNRTRITHPDGKYFTYQYDKLNGLTAIAENEVSALLTLSYNNQGFRKQISRNGGASTNYEFDPIGRFKSLTQNFSGTVNDLTSSFTYNPASQVISHLKTNNSFSYTGNNDITGNYEINGLNQYTSAGGKSLSYDAKGNLTSDGSSSYTYDIENRLLTASGATNATLKYDPLGRLYETSGGGVTTRFLYDGDSLVAEYNASGTMLKRYVHGSRVDEPLVVYNGSNLSSSSRYYLHMDHQGSIIAKSNTSATLITKNSYDAYGIPFDNNTGRFAYTGQILIPELKLYYYKARMYSPKLGRFMQVDPIGYEDQVNLYGYVGNDPFNKIDPSGREQWAAYYGRYLQGEDLVALEDCKGCATAVELLFPGVGLIEAKQQFDKGNTGLAVFSVATEIPILKWLKAAKKAKKALKATKSVANPVPATLARVVPGNINPKNLGTTADVFVTDAKALQGLNAKQIADKLTIPQSLSGFKVIEFPTPSSGIASPVFRNNPGFVGGGRTAGGAPEFVIPNGPVPAGATTRIVQ